jgi:hypothetical protein
MFRKAALCYINAGDVPSAMPLILLCPEDEASTHYLAFLAALKSDSGLCGTLMPTIRADQLQMASQMVSHGS